MTTLHCATLNTPELVIPYDLSQHVGPRGHVE